MTEPIEALLETECSTRRCLFYRLVGKIRAE